MSYFLQQLLNGIQLGSMYALIALGYTMVYGIIKLINFAHADIFMVGAYMAFFVTAFAVGSTAALPPQVWICLSLIAGYLLFSAVSARIPVFRLKPGRSVRSGRHRIRVIKGGISIVNVLFFAIGMIACASLCYPVLFFGTRALFGLHWGPLLLPVTLVYVMFICGLLGVAMERIAYRPLRSKPRISALITALGVSLFLENFASLPIAFGNQYRPFPALMQKADVVRFDGLGIGISNTFVVNVSVLAVLLVALWFLVEKTLIGKQMRAVSFDFKTASLMGIDVDRVISFTFVLGPSLAGVAGTLYALNYGILQSPFLGFFPGIKAFIAAVLGGIGSLPGAVLGAFVMGTTEVFANSVDSNLGFAAAFAVLIVILLVRPNGLLGRKTIEKV
jgi:branched-chain amino acid transport system permease protein